MAASSIASGRATSSMLARIAAGRGRDASTGRPGPSRATGVPFRSYSTRPLRSTPRQSLYTSPHRRDPLYVGRPACLTPAGTRALSLWPFGGGSKPEAKPTETLSDPTPLHDPATGAEPAAAPIDASVHAPPPPDVPVDIVTQPLGPSSAVQELANLHIEHGFLGKALSANAEWLMCQIHDLTALPWVYAIPLSVVFIRFCLLKMQIDTMGIAVRNMLAKPAVEDKMRQVREAQRDGQHADQLRLQKEMQAVIKDSGFSPFGMFKFPLIQGFIFSTLFFAFKNMGQAGLPSMMNEGALWFVDLTAPGVAYGLPLLASSLTLLTLETAADMGGVQNPSAQKMRWAFRGLIVFMFYLLYDLPSAIFVFWVTNNLCTLFWSLGSRRTPDSIRRLVGMPTKAEMANVAKISLEAQQKQMAANGGKPMGFMESIRTMQEQALKAREQAERTQVIRATPIPPSTSSSSASSSTEFFERPTASTASASAFEAPSLAERTTHGALNVESPAGHAEGAEVGSGVQVGEVGGAAAAAATTRGGKPKKKRFGKAIKEAEPVSRR